MSPPPSSCPPPCAPPPRAAPDRLPALVCGSLLGLLLQLQQAQPLPATLRAALAGAGLLLALLGGWIRRPNVAALLLGLACSALALAWTDQRAATRLAERLEPALEGRTLEVEGRVAGLPVARAEGLRFVVEVERYRIDGTASPPGAGRPARLMLGWYGDGVYGEPDPARLAPADFGPGQRWRWTVRLRLPHGAVNPQGFDAELWLFEQGIGASGTVRSEARWRPQRLAEAPAHSIDAWRMAVRRAIDAQVGDARLAGLVAGLAIGDQAAIAAADWAVVRITGVAHLLAVSGLHITLWALLARAGVGALWRCSGRAMLACPAPVVARWAGLLAAVLYALAAGWGVPAQRTVLMLAIWTLLQGGARRWSAPRVLGVCAWGVLLADPWAALQPGFWLSFVAVALLMGSGAAPARGATALSARETPWPWLRERLGAAGRAQLVASVGLAPWTAIFFNQVSLVGLLANALAIPLVTGLIMPLALAGLLWAPAWSIAAALLEAGMAGLGVLGGWPLAAWSLPASPLALQLLAAAGAALLVWPLPAALRLAGAMCCLPLLAPAPERPPQGQFQLLGLDIGQGNAVLLRTRHHLLLYDAGPRFGREGDAGERLVLPLLGALGLGPLDLLVLSHRDSDHTGGAASLIDAGRVRRLSSSLETGHALRRRGVPHQPCRAGQRWRWDGVDFEILHPAPAELAQAEAGRLRPNGLSCVLRVQAGGPARRTVLLAGDIEREQEAAIIARGAALQAEVLLVPHHGSRTSSSPDWLRAVRPRWALVQAGYRNRYGHPAIEVLQRYDTHDIGLIRTDSCGAWHWHSADASSWCERARHPRYWRAPLQGGGPEFAKDLTSNKAKP